MIEGSAKIISRKPPTRGVRFCNWSGVSANGFLGLSKYFIYGGIDLYYRYLIMARPSLAHPKFHSLTHPHSLAHSVSKMSLTCAPSSSLILELVTALSSLLAVGCGGVGWGGTKTFMFLGAHKHSNLIIFLAVLQTRHCSFMIRYRLGWGGVGGTITFFCSRADTDVMDTRAPRNGCPYKKITERMTEVNLL